MRKWRIHASGLGPRVLWDVPSHGLLESGFAQRALTWHEIRDKFEAAEIRPYEQDKLASTLNTQADYRSVQVNYLNLIASYLNAANQLNLAVGREVIP